MRKPTTAYTRFFGKRWEKELREMESLLPLTTYKIFPFLYRIGFTRLQHQVVPTRSTLANTMEDQTPAELHDESSPDATKTTAQAQVDGEDYLDRIPLLVQIDDLEGASAAQMVIAFTNSEQAALVKRLKDLARKHEEIAV